MHVAADRPQEVLAAAEHLVFVAVEHAARDQAFGLAHAIDIFGDPEQRVQVAQPALAVLDVGFDQVARLAGAAMALLALGELGGDECRRGALRHFFVEARGELVKEFDLAEQVARFQKRGAHRHVGFGLTDAFVNRTRCMADFQSHVPQAIEQRLGDLLAPGGLLVRQQEQQIDVGAGREQAAAIAAGRDHRHVFGFRRHLRRIKFGTGEVEQDADDLVLHSAQPLGAAPPVAVLEQQIGGMRARGRERRFQPQRHRGAQFALAPGMGLRQRLKIGGERFRIDQIAGQAVRTLGVEHRRYE
jgi:hypothetical protein